MVSMRRTETHHALVSKNRLKTMSDMTHAMPIPVPGSEFNDFLFAPIGEDQNGMLVSVLSGLARSDVDPWQEAARLAQLPGESATRRLAALIGALPDRAVPFPDPRMIATRLIALLPRRSRFDFEPQQTLQRSLTVMNSRPWWISIAAMAFVLGSQFLIASHQTPAKPDNVEKNATDPASPQPPPTNSGH
jgi:hypothetical protein